MENSGSNQPSVLAQRMAALEADLAALRQKYADDLHACNQQVKTLQRDAHDLQHDYEVLRVQKGGFGFKMLVLSGFIGFCCGLVLCYLYFRPTNARAEAFAEFRREHLFKLEYALSHGEFDDAEARLRHAGSETTFTPIHGELEAMHQLVVAARRSCDSLAKGNSGN